MNFHELDNFNLDDAVKFHHRLNPRIWGSDEHLLPEVREKLQAIAADFQEFLGVDDLKVQDLTISGSNAAYSYTPHSDIDLHLVVEMPDDPVYQELFTAKKYQYNDEHDIRIGGVPVELYVQPADQAHVSQGIYSIKNGDWTQVPQRRRAKVDDSCVQHKAADLDARIHAAVKSGNADAINRLWDHIKQMRQAGLEQNGEFGCENITFKLLRNMGCIGRLKDAKTALRDRELSLEQSKKPRKRVNYGMRDYWYPGTAYAGQDHPAGTESEQVDEAVGEDGSPKVYAIGDSHGEGLSYTKGIINYAHGGQPSTSSSNYSGNYNGHPTGIDNVPDGSFVVISQGCNDAANSSRANLDSKGKIPLVSPDTIANNVVRLVNAALAKRCKVVVVLFPNGDPNTRPYYGGPYQEKVRQAIKASVGVPVVDLEGSPLADGVHAVPSAYKAAGSKVLSIFKTINEASSGPDPDHLKKILHRFYDSCVDKLKLKNPPRLRLETTPDWSRENGSFGQYEPETNTLILATAGRHVLDILRTMAHEMTHRQQDEKSPLPADAGETGSPYEDQANAMAGRIMRQWAEEQPDMFDGATLEEASGYIPTKKQARDPRFVMALTRDVQPGAVGREANKLGLQTDSQGHPALLTAGLQKLLREFKEQDLFEINMGGKNLRKEAAKTGALAGMEFEMIVPNTQSEDDGDLEPDYDQDERASSPRDIRDFFYDGDYNSRRSVDDLIDSMMNDFSDWKPEAFDGRWDSDSKQYIYDYIKENMDDDDVRGLLGLESEDPISREEYRLAADKITAEQIEPWYEDAQESAREGFYEDDDQFEEWLSDAGLTHMSDIENRYSGDINWPHYRSVSSGDGASVQETAESFSAAVGRPARASDSYHEYGQERPAPGKNFYVVEPDGSLNPDDPDDAGLEFVSPPLPIDEIMSDLNKVKKWADLNGCYTNKSTGLHINISVPNYDLKRLDFVKLALLMGDEYVLEQFGRVSNTYARSAMGKVRDHVQKRPYEAKYLLDKMKGHMGELASKAIHAGITDKYTSINTKDGHVEFRSPGGDWLGDNFSMIENTLLRFTVALSAAMDPRAYREEYLKKLYKILAPNGEKDPLAVFAKYAAGELPAAALKSFVRQAQADRRAKKSGENIVNAHRWRVTLKPELGGGVVEVMATDPIDAKKQAKIEQPNWRFADDSALTVTRLDDSAAGVDQTAPHPQGRGRPNDPNGRYAIVNRDDPLVFAYGSGTSSPAPDYLFRFSLPDDFTQAQMRAVMSAWAARENANAADYMIVDTTQFAAPEQTAAPESGSVQWNIIDRNNNLVHTFWNTNVQRDANTAAHEWLMANDELPSVDMQGPFDVVPAAIPGSTQDLQRQRQAADAAANTRRWADYEASQTPAPVAGVQDIEPDVEQYTSQPAQTQWEVYDRSTNQPVFRMYAENQAEAWRKGQEWVANNDWEINAANYSVRQSTAPVSESREITKLGKLDSVLEKCIEMIRRGHESDPEKYGRVAACLIDNKNNHTYAINMPGPGGTRRHAERMAIDKHLQRHGRIGPNAIMVTTLSPCVNHMDERYGESCTDLLSDYGIEKCYAGWQDPTQHPEEDYPFNLKITDNTDIFNTCRDIAASFLPQAMAEDSFDGIDITMEVEDDEVMVRATAGGRELGHVLFVEEHGHLMPQDLEVDERYRGQGIAAAMYDYVKSKGYKIRRSGQQTDAGAGFWHKHRLEQNVWEHDVDEAYDGPQMKFLRPGELSGSYSPQQMQAMGFKQSVNGSWYIPMNIWQRLVSGGQIRENFADGRNPQDKGDAKRHGINTKASVSSLRKTAKQGGRKGQLAHWLANMKSGRAKAKNKTNEAVDQQTVDGFTTRANSVRETIARNADPQYQKAIRNIPIRIMNGNPSNTAFAQGGTLNIDAEEWYNAPDEVLLLVMGHEVGHILFGHDTRPAGTVVPIQQDQQEEYDGDDFALEIAQKLGIKKIPVWTWLHRKKNDLEQVKQRQRANPPGPWPTYDDRSDRALRRRGVKLVQISTDQIDQAIQQLEHLA
jgi:pyrimidine deaminase RibD-like protein/GNAT superfamily N-acetyltransferase